MMVMAYNAVSVAKELSKGHLGHFLFVIWLVSFPVGFGTSQCFFYIWKGYENDKLFLILLM
jgi:hypothetical protein